MPHPSFSPQLALSLLALLVQVRQGQHVHYCGVSGCGNYYHCDGARCAGSVWLCPACEMDERDRFVGVAELEDARNLNLRA